MNSIRSRFIAIAGVFAFAAILDSCADKPFQPASAPGSKKMSLQISAQGITTAGAKKILVAAVAYATASRDSDPTDTLQILAGPVVAQVTGAAQRVSITVDLTKCLSDPLRHGSQTACSIVYGVWLRDSAGFADTTDFTKYAYDYSFNGPIDIAPGVAPTLPPINLSITKYAIHDFEADEALRLGGSFTPNNFSGPINGSAAGLASGAAATIYALTNGNVGTGNNPVGFVAAQLATLSNGTWSLVSGPSSVGRFNDMAVGSSTDIFLAGNTGLYHYDGTAITAIPGVPDNLVSIALVGSGTSRYVIAGTSNGAIWFGNGANFQKVSAPGGITSSIDGVCVNAANDAFALSLSTGNVYHFDGTSLSQIPTTFTGTKQDLQCPGPGQAYVTLNTSSVLKWNGSGWTQLPTIAPSRGNFHIAVVSANEIYAAGDSASINRAFYRFDGIGWVPIGRLQFTQGISTRPWADPRGGAAYFASAFGRVEKVTSTSAVPISYSPSIRDLIMTSATSAFAVGWNYFLARYDGTRWNVDPPPGGTQTVRILTGVWSDGPTNAWAVGNGNTILRWDGTKWNVVSDISHPITSPGDSYNAVWGSGGSVWAAGFTSILRCRTISSCAPDPVSGIDSLFGIWGTSTTNAYAVGAHGKILHFDGTSWTSMTSATKHKLVRVWGSGPTDVWALGDSAIVHYDGTVWANATGTADVLSSNGGPSGNGQSSFQLGIWGTGPKEVYVTSFYGSIHRWDGQQWTEVQSVTNNTGAGRVVAISGYPGGCAFALIDGSSANPGSPTLMRGVGPGGCLSAPTGASPSWP